MPSTVYSQLVDALGEARGNFPFDEQSSLTDKVELEIGELQLVGDPVSIEEVTNYLTSLDLEISEEHRHPTRPTFGSAFFAAPQGIHLVWRKIAIRKMLDTRVSVPGIPIVGGDLQITVARRTEMRASFNVRIGLQLNITRAFRHNAFLAARARPHRILSFQPSNLFSLRLQPSVFGENILTSSDNALLELPNLRDALRPNFAIFRDQYVRYVINFLINSIGEAAASVGAILRGDPEYNLVRVETYWERADLDPIGYVKSLERPIAEYGNVARFDEYQPMTSRFREENATVAKCRLSRGVEFVAYAKTTDRVRFEVRHNMRNGATPMGTAHTTNDLVTLTSWMTECARDAQSRLNLFRSYLNTSRSPAATPALIVEFFDILRDVCGAVSERTNILSMLVHNGSIHVSNTELRSLLNRLVRRGLLVKSARGYRMVSEAYRPVIERLRQERDV